MKLIEKLFFSVLLVFSSYSFAQGTVSGSVVDTDGNPLPGVTVIIEGTSQGTSTDFDGNYSITVDSNQTLQFSFIGFESQNIRVGNQSSIDVVMQTSAQALDEIVVTGYGTQTKRETTGAGAAAPQAPHALKKIWIFSSPPGDGSAFLSDPTSSSSRSCSPPPPSLPSSPSDSCPHTQ